MEKEIKNFNIKIKKYNKFSAKLRKYSSISALVGALISTAFILAKIYYVSEVCVIVTVLVPILMDITRGIFFILLWMINKKRNKLIIGDEKINGRFKN